MKHATRALALALCAGALVMIGIWLWLQTTIATASEFAGFKRGDIIFQTSGSGQSLAILMASRSPFTHMGIIDMEADGSMVVLEATTTTRATPLAAWVKNGNGQRIAVYRAEDLSRVEVDDVIAAARSHFGKRYDVFFFESEKELYCSELVYIAFRDGAKTELGQFQNISSLDLNGFAARKIIQSRWQRYPLCADGKAKTFETCFKLIQNQTLITPRSISEDPELRLIYSNYGVLD